MKKDLITHFLYVTAFFILATLIRNWFDLSYYPFWLGGIVGTLLPDVDYLVYIYYLKPEAKISQQATTLIKKKSWVETWNLLSDKRSEHPELIFHSVFFQIIFIIFAFLIVTSSGSLFGIGMVLAFMLHLLVDQLVDFFEKGGIGHWFSRLNVSITKKQEKWYLIAQITILILFGFFF